MPVLRTIVNRQREFNPQAFRVFGPKIVAMRGGFDDPALESRFITEETGSRMPRPDIPIHLPPTFKAEARALRNRLLHYRLVHLFETQPDPSALMESVAPRVNQTAFATLSLVDDLTLRADIKRLLVEQDERLRAERQEAVDVQVLKAAYDAFHAAEGTDVPLRTIADIFNAANCSEYGRPISNKWIGHILRKQLHLSTAKSRGVYMVRRSELPKIEAMARRFGLGGETPEATVS